MTKIKSTMESNKEEALSGNFTYEVTLTKTLNYDLTNEKQVNFVDIPSETHEIKLVAYESDLVNLSTSLTETLRSKLDSKSLVNEI